MRSVRSFCVCAALLFLAAAACGESDDSGGSGTAQASDTIAIRDFSFGDPPTVASGTRVTVENEDSAVHTWTSDDGVWDSGNLAQGDTFEFVFSESGEFPFHCEIHRSMTGKVAVSG